jgi:IS5 family transposase
LAESLRVAHEIGALRSRDLARVTVDTTVQPKNITFPTEAKLLHAAIKGLTRLAKKHAVRRARRPDLLAAAAPTRLEAVFLPCPGGGVHRQG